MGSKDRQPRVKRMATSPHPSETGDKAPCESEGRRKPWNIILTAEQAVEIYRKRAIGPNWHATSSCRSNEVAEQYGVNSKTIRDIWNRATWVKATRHAWTVEEEADYVHLQSAISRASDGNSTSTDHDATRSSESEVHIRFFFPTCLPEHSKGVVADWDCFFASAGRKCRSK